jgi:hypothetical protein
MHKNRVFCFLKTKANCNSPPTPDGPKAKKKLWLYEAQTDERKQRRSSEESFAPSVNAAKFICFPSSEN